MDLASLSTPLKELWHTPSMIISIICHSALLMQNIPMEIKVGFPLHGGSGGNFRGPHTTVGLRKLINTVTPNHAEPAVTFGCCQNVTLAFTSMHFLMCVMIFR